MKNKNQKPLKLKKTKILKFYQMDTLLGGLANSSCVDTCEATPIKAPIRKPAGN